MNHALITLREELRALQDARRSMLTSGEARALAPTDALLSQTLREINEVKAALELLRKAQPEQAKPAAPIRYAGFDPTERPICPRRVA